MDIDDINRKVGGCGRFHYIAFFLLAVNTFKQAINLQGLTFALYVPTYKCDIPKTDYLNGTNSFRMVSEDQCSYRLNNKSKWIPCDKWTYDRNIMTSSLITEFNLICAKEHYQSLFFTVFFVSHLVGYPFVIISDKIGRKFLLLFFLYISIPITLIQIYTYNLWLQFVLTFFTGFSKCVYMSLSLTTLVEIIPSERFDLAVTNFWLFYGIGYMCTAAFAYFGRCWQFIYLMSLTLCVSYPFYICFVPETPRWLLVKGKKEESFKVVSYIAKINKRSIDKNDFDKWQPKENVTGNLWVILKYKRMIVRCLVLMITAWSFSFSYIGTSTDLKFASDNIFITTFVMGIVEVPTGPVAALVAKFMNRKNGITLLCAFGILSLLSLPFIEADVNKSVWQPWLKVILAMVGKLGLTSSWCMFDVITNELMPTSIRSGGISIVYVCVCLGSIVIPTVHKASLDWHYAAPCYIYAIHIIVTVLLIRLVLPETKGLPLPQTVEEAASLEKNKELAWKKYMTEKASEDLNKDSIL